MNKILSKAKNISLLYKLIFLSLIIITFIALSLPYFLTSLSLDSIYNEDLFVYFLIILMLSISCILYIIFRKFNTTYEYKVYGFRSIFKFIIYSIFRFSIYCGRYITIAILILSVPVSLSIYLYVINPLSTQESLINNYENQQSKNNKHSDDSIEISLNTLVNNEKLDTLKTTHVISFFNTLRDDKKIKNIYIYDSFVSSELISYDNIIEFFDIFKKSSKTIYYIIDQENCYKNNMYDKCILMASYADKIYSQFNTNFINVIESRDFYHNYNISDFLNAKNMKFNFSWSRGKLNDYVLDQNSMYSHDKESLKSKNIINNIKNLTRIFESTKGSNAIANLKDGYYSAVELFNKNIIDYIYKDTKELKNKIKALDEYNYKVEYENIYDIIDNNKDIKDVNQDTIYVYSFSNPFYEKYLIELSRFFINVLKAKNAKSIKVLFNSYGGHSPLNQMNLVNYIKENSNIELEGIIENECYSACIMQLYSFPNISMGLNSLWGSIGAYTKSLNSLYFDQEYYSNLFQKKISHTGNIIDSKNSDYPFYILNHYSYMQVMNNNNIYDKYFQLFKKQFINYIARNAKLDLSKINVSLEEYYGNGFSRTSIEVYEKGLVNNISNSISQIRNASHINSKDSQKEQYKIVFYHSDNKIEYINNI